MAHQISFADSLVLHNPNPDTNPNPADWTTSSRSSTSFQPFPKLSPELRVMIYKLLPTEPRCVEVTYRYKKINVATEPLRLWPAVSSKTKPPAVLSICRESRHVGLEQYANLSDCWSGRRIYLNPETDSLLWTPQCLSFPSCQPRMRPPKAIWEMMPAQQRSKIRKLIVPCSTLLGSSGDFVYEFEDGSIVWEELFCGAWSCDARRRNETNCAENFGLLWIFQFFSGLDELTVLWYARNWKLDRDGTPRYNSGEDHEKIQRLRERDFESRKVNAEKFVRDMSDFYQAVNPNWNPPRLTIVRSEVEHHVCEQNLANALEKKSSPSAIQLGDYLFPNYSN